MPLVPPPVRRIARAPGDRRGKHDGKRLDAPPFVALHHNYFAARLCAAGW
jgi:hypothetical protein